MSNFPTTRWSLISRAAHGTSPTAEEALADLLGDYRMALRSFLVGTGKARASEADDLVHGFLLDKVLMGRLLHQADRSRGRFRYYVMKALSNYVFECRRRERSTGSAPGRTVSLDSEHVREPISNDEQIAMDLAWAKQLVQRALRDMRAECERKQRGDLWRLFDMRVVRPVIEGVAPVPYDDLVTEFGFESPSRAANALTTGKRMYERCLRAAIADYARDDAEIEEELRSLREVLSRGSALSSRSAHRPPRDACHIHRKHG